MYKHCSVESSPFMAQMIQFSNMATGLMAIQRYNPLLIYVSSLIIVSFLLTFTNAATNVTILNVADLGALPDGKTDSNPAFLNAWAIACSLTEPTSIYVPRRTYLLSQIVFQGPCNNTAGITFRIEGILVAPSYTKMGASENWIMFNQVEGVAIVGGILDGQGSNLWECKLGKQSAECPAGVTSLAFYSSKDISIQGLLSVNAELYHMVIHTCTNVVLQRIRITAPEDSPNTDGIHVQNSFKVRVLNTSIGTGDDCVSIGPGTKNLWIEHVACGPGHGISIGSLAKGAEEEGVEDVMVKNVAFTGTQNGLRIKAWARPSNGYVRGIVFKQALMNNVQNPILIDQNYCPRNENCPGQHSGVQISQVTYSNITGTSATQVAMKFDCSKTSPCEGIKVENIQLTYQDQKAQSFCQNARGVTRAPVFPPSCL